MEKKVIYRPWSVRIDKNCALGLEYGGSLACGLGPYNQDLGHIFSLYGPPAGT